MSATWEDVLSMVDAARTEVTQTLEGNIRPLSELVCREEESNGIVRHVTVLEQLTRVLQTLDCAAQQIGDMP